jgi:outer membrane protein assembly factor BamB
MKADLASAHLTTTMKAHPPTPPQRLSPCQVLALSALTCCCLAGSALADEAWSQFRGPDGNGCSGAKGLPLTWSETEHIKWKTALPGQGWSSPVVLGNQIWMQTALDEGKSLRAVCVALDSGKLLHDVEIFHIAVPQPKHELNSFASPTPVVEPGRLYVSFGMDGVACLDTAKGSLVWTSTELKHDHDKSGPGSSPIIHGNLFILNCDGTELRYVAALDKNTGSLVWKTPRSNNLQDRAGPERKAFGTPQVISHDGRAQLISEGAFRVSSYDPATGKELWWVDIPGFSNVPRPIYGHGLVYVATGFAPAQLFAIRPDGTGDVTRTHVAWKVKQQAPLKPSLLLAGDELYMVSDTGMASCLNATTGAEYWHERIGSEYSASPVSADGRLYFFDHRGQCTVLAPGTNFTALATNRLAAGFMASPAVAGRAFILRTRTHLYRVEI